jgi:hypothetical protein
MNLPQHLAKQFRESYFGKNWTWVHLKEHLDTVTWEQATMKIHSLNSIAMLANHINYYTLSQTKVLEGKPLDSKDEYSWNHPPIESQEDWDNFRNQIYKDGEHLAGLIEQLPEERLWEIFVDPKYGNYIRNIQGMTEHVHYHLGQIVIIKKLLDTM